ncbi:hypothetical protein [Pelagivirga sediminicola]|uniref:hypothetical protein n=1 Tax=Pelagivirga sediminicola TaxID=2170575 RepID=UPI001056E934|nr:hypothetical protein [Pelagivirga sediminicola]
MIEIDGAAEDAALTAALRKGARAAGCVLIAGDLSAGLGAPDGWIALLSDMSALPIVAAAGSVGTRGLALILLADVAVIGADAAWVGADVAALAELAVLRLGALNARRVLLAADPLSELCAIGHATRADAPLDTARSRAAALAPTGQRLRQGWRAARDLPAGEALTYAGWFNSISTKEAS